MPEAALRLLEADNFLSVLGHTMKLVAKVSEEVPVVEELILDGKKHVGGLKETFKK